MEAKVSKGMRNPNARVLSSKYGNQLFHDP